MDRFFLVFSEIGDIFGLLSLGNLEMGFSGGFIFLLIFLLCSCLLMSMLGMYGCHGNYVC